MAGRWFEEFIVGRTFESNQENELVYFTLRRALRTKKPGAT